MGSWFSWRVMTDGDGKAASLQRKEIEGFDSLKPNTRLVPSAPNVSSVITSGSMVKWLVIPTQQEIKMMIAIELQIKQQPQWALSCYTTIYAKKTVGPVVRTPTCMHAAATGLGAWQQWDSWRAGRDGQNDACAAARAGRWWADRPPAPVQCLSGRARLPSWP